MNRSFHCDLCGVSGSPDDKPYDGHLFGLYWETGSRGDYLVARRCQETERHICYKCLRQLSVVFERTKK